MSRHPLSEGRPLLAVSGSSWEPAEVSSHVLWIVGGRLFAPESCPQVLARSRGHTCRTLRGTGSVSSAILTIRKVPEWHVGVVPGATEVAVTCSVGRLSSIGGRRAATTPYVQCCDRGLGCWPRGHVKEGTVPDATGITPSGVQNEGRRARRREVSAQAGDENPSARSQPANCPSEHSFFTGLGCDVVNKTTPLTSALSSPRWVP